MKILFILIYFSLLLHGAEFIVQDSNETVKKKQWIVLPYLFSSDSTGLTGGFVGIFHGYIQPQMTIVATAYGGEKMEAQKYTPQEKALQDTARTQGYFLGVSGYNIPGTKRLFLTALASYTYYPNQRIYVDGKNDSVRSLTHDATNLTPVQTQGENNWANLDFRYVLPFGESRKNPLPIIKLNQGIPTNRKDYGGGAPFVTGQSIIGMEVFYEKTQIDKLAHEPFLISNGLRLYLQHDNTDYPDNPSHGYNFEIKGSVDFGIGRSSQSWNSIEGSYSHYIALQKFSWSRQNVLAMNIWSAYSPSWQRDDSDETIIDAHRPPMWEGAHLGGWKRLRAYDSDRFSDKAALYGAVEFRTIFKYNPLAKERWVPVPIDWFQAVVFAEAGRVNKRYNIAELTSNMKYDVGVSLRALAAKVPIRFDIAYGEEGSSMWVMIHQPF